MEREYYNTHSQKGDQVVYSNCRGIFLINSAYKVLPNILLGRLTTFVENIIGDDGFPAETFHNKPTVDDMSAAREALEYNKPLHHLFIDFQKAYDSVTRAKLWNAMEELSIPKKIIQLTKMCVSKSRSTVKT